jgi:hypothetical protein
MNGGRLATALAALTLLRPFDARAEGPAGAPAPLALSVVRLPGAESCDRGAVLASGVEQRLGHPVFGPPQGGAGSIEVTLAADGAAFRASVRSFDAQGEPTGVREVKPTGASCATLVDALVVVLSVMIDPEAALAPRPVPRPQPETPPHAAPPEFTPPPREPQPEPAAAPPARSATLFTRIGFGELPATSVSFGAAYTHQLGPIALYLDARASLPTERRRSIDTEGVRMSIATATLGLCPLATRDPVLRFSACVGAELGGWFVSSFGVRDPRKGVEPHAAGSARIAAQVALSEQLAVSLAATGSALVLRPELVFDVADGSRETVYHAPPLTGAAEVGLSTRF